MPYNNTPITPSKEVTGTVALPLARVKKIIAQDDDISNCSNNAAFVITVAAEMFLQHLVEQSYNIVKSERKPRRNIQYRDVANAVSRVENLEFLTDVVPKTTSYRQHKQKQRQQQTLAETGTDDATAVEGEAPAPRPSSQGKLTFDGRVVMPEVTHPIREDTSESMPKVEVQIPRQEAEEVQATNGASHAYTESDAMDVDADEEGSMHTAPDERGESAGGEDREMEHSEESDAEYKRKWGLDKLIKKP